ncbi:MAG: helix-turn-helix transcriptional regulator [Lachnospiraceae bacterium]|nr:helix-turn-helix transcriptional regulator [Lachnospiraceae bacterium]MBQ9232921.1 helix-turn-helix transcriptional regulator [Lachnospiraceae bacterium]
MVKSSVDYSLIGRRVRYYRTLRNLTQANLAEIVGVADNYISMIESGYKKASLETLVAICNALNITMDVLLMDNLKSKYFENHSVLEELFSECSKEETLFVMDIITSLIDTLHTNRYVLMHNDL